MKTRDVILERLTEALLPLHVEVLDDSGRHAGHRGARESGGGHYQVTVVAAVFSGRPLLERHRAIYQALTTELSSVVHALRIAAYSPEEWKLIRGRG